jgi:membrane-associated phospholipid phosphatase
MIFEYRLDANPPRAARVYALLNLAWIDAGIACWDAKYTYWAPRPQMADPAITTVFVTPNHPSYPSAHSCFAGASAGVLGRLFPRDAGSFNALAEEVGEARIMAGIHFRSDIEVGEALGRQVAAVAWARRGRRHPLNRRSARLNVARHRPVYSGFRPVTMSAVTALKKHPAREASRSWPKQVSASDSETTPSASGIRGVRSRTAP